MKIRTVAAAVVTTLALSACSDRQSPTSPLKSPGAPSATVTVSSQAALNAQINGEIDGLFTGFARLYEHAYWNWIVAEVSSCTSVAAAQRIDADLDALVSFMSSHANYFTSSQAQKLVQLINDMSTYVDNALSLCGIPDA